MITQHDGRPLRLLVISHLFAPDVCGGAAIFSDMCYGLAQRNIDVTVRCGYPYYPEWKDKSGTNGVRIECGPDKGVHIERYGMFIPRNPRSPWQRVLYEGSFFLSLSRSLVRRGRFDAVIVFCPLAGSVAFAALYKMFRGTPVWLNVQDLPADAAAASKIVASGPARIVLQAVQRWLFNRTDLWSSISPVMVDRLHQLRDRRQPVIFLPNWLHQSIAARIDEYPSKVGRIPSRPVRLLYAGNIGSKQGLLRLCETLGETTTQFQFRIHGDGGAASEVRDWLARSRDPRFSIRPVLDEASFVDALHQADFLIITEKSESGASFFPSKTVPAIASGTPILAVCDPDSPLGQEMRTQNVGPWFSWTRCSEIGDLLASIDAHEQDFAGWQRNAIRRSESFSREVCLDSVMTTLNRICGDSVDLSANDLLDATPAALPI